MVNVAVLGYGTIGKGVVDVLQINADLIEKRAGDRVKVKHILDLRDFPNDPNRNLVVHDYSIIDDDPDVDLVVECMGGIHPAYDFIKAALLKGRSVCTSNKALVAEKGPELLALAKEQNVNFLFEASVGGGIPIIRPLTQCLTADDIIEISGIMNGTTNYMLTKMEEQGYAFDDVLKEAQAKGYAEADPSADIEGYDACRKTAILASLITGNHVDYKDIHTEGITKITTEDFEYARKMGRVVKLLGKYWSANGKHFALVCPMLLKNDHPLAGIKDVYNSIFVRGNMVGDTMFYGQGAGAHPTASAVCGDVVDCVRNADRNLGVFWEAETLKLDDYGEYPRQYFVRADASCTLEQIRDAFGQVEMISIENVDEKAFITASMKEEAFRQASKKLGNVKTMIRMDMEAHMREF